MQHRSDTGVAPFFELAMAKRPAEELYDLSKDPGQTNNVAGVATYAEAQKGMAARLDSWMKETKDPRASGGGDEFDKYPYFGMAPQNRTRSNLVGK